MSFIKRLNNVQLLVLDVDGVLTDGKLYYTDSGKEIKAFNVHDGEGLKQIRQYGIRTAIISGRKSEATQRRSQELLVDEIHMGENNKLSVLKGVIQRNGGGPIKRFT